MNFPGPAPTPGGFGIGFATPGGPTASHGQGLSKIKFAFTPPTKAFLSRRAAPHAGSTPAASKQQQQQAADTLDAAAAAAADRTDTEGSGGSGGSQTGTNILALSAINSGVKCSSCMVRNKVGATKCVSCETPLWTDAVATTSTSGDNDIKSAGKGASEGGDSGSGGTLDIWAAAKSGNTGDREMS